MKHLRLCVALVLIAPALGGPQALWGASLGAPQGVGERQEWEALRKRTSEPRNYNLLAGGLWALTHGAGEKAQAEVKGLLTLISKLGEPFEQQQVGGAAGFKEKVAVFLKSEDDVVRGYAASVMAAIGDRSYAPRIAELLERKDPPEDDYSSHPLTSRGRAAVALGLLGARGYVGKLASMLGSPNRYDRSGAALALGYLGAKEHAKALAALLTDERFKHEDSDSPIYALFEMGVAAEYADVFASVTHDVLWRSETVKTAVYALAALKSKRHVKDIALLLEHKYLRRDAAKALAIMGADEYAPRIARMLDDDDSLDQGGALLALGILGAKQYAPRAARILKEQKESFVSNYAAEALVLMGADEYAAEVVPLLEKNYKEKLYLGLYDFHPLVEGELPRLMRRYEESFVKMLARRAK